MTDLLHVQGTEIRVLEKNQQQYICLTDMAMKFGSQDLIRDWLKNKNTLEFLGVWEHLNNPSFSNDAFAKLLAEAGTNRFRVSVKQWVTDIGGKGIFATAGRYGATFAHTDIAVEFGSWLSPEFKLYLITELQRLKKAEHSEITFERSVRRIMAKAGYHIHTDSVKEFLIPPDVTKQQQSWIYANEADVLNVAVFGMTAKQWRDQNPGKKGNIRDDEEIASVFHLVVLNNLESQNALLIQQGKSRPERLAILNKEARRQFSVLMRSNSLNTIVTPQLLEIAKK